MAAKRAFKNPRTKNLLKSGQPPLTPPHPCPSPPAASYRCSPRGERERGGGGGPGDGWIVARAAGATAVDGHSPLTSRVIGKASATPRTPRTASAATRCASRADT